MNEKIFYGVLIVAVLVVGGISWFILNRPVPPPVPVVPPTISPQEPIQEATTTENKPDGKTCATDLDCVFKHGCYCSCYNKSYRDEKLESMFCSCETTGKFPDCKCENDKCVPVVKTTEIILSGPREDEKEPCPIEENCQKVIEGYIKGSVGAFEFQNKGFSECKLIESKVGWGEKECINGFSPQGCYICKLGCR